MKKLIGLFLLTGVAASLSACSMSLPTCNDELNECGRDSAYTEERTAKAKHKMPAPAPMPAPEPIPAPEPVVEAPKPAPAPVVVDDTPVMRSAEPMVQHVSK